MSILEATQSATSNLQSLLISNPVFAYAVSAAAGAVGGVVLSLVTRLGEARIKELFEERKRKKALIRQAAQDIISFVVEGMCTDFRHKAGSFRAIEFRAAEIETIDDIVGTKLRAFVGVWSQHRNLIKQLPHSLESDKEAVALNKKARKLGDELLEVAKHWAR